MKKLQILATLQRSDVFIGESLPLRVEVRNEGSEPAAIPNRLGPSEFEFAFRRAEGGDVVTVVSSDDAAAHQTPDPVPPVRPQRATLAPGASATYQLDPGQFFTTPLSPGSYLVSAAFGEGAERIESAGVPVRVLAPRVTDFATVVQPGASRAVVALAAPLASEKGSAVLALVGSNSNPRHGVFHRFGETAPPLAITSVALACEFKPSLQETWLAWVRGDRIEATLIQVSSVRHRADVGVTLRSFTLHHAAWRPTPTEAWFAGLGLDANGRLGLAVARFQIGAAPAVQVIPLGGTQLPVWWRLGYRTGSGGPRLILVASEARGSSTRLVQQVIDLTRGSATEATTLIERSTPLLALAFDPVGSTDGTDVVDTLVATERDDAATLLRVPLAGAGKPAEWSVPVPDSMTIRQLRNWALPARRMAEPAVVVKIGDRLLAHRVGAAGGWMTLAEQSAGADHLRLEVIEGHPWACWVDATMGVRLEFLR